MDKQLKEIDFEEMLHTSFTEENKQSVLEKINKIEQKRKKPHYFQNALAVVFSAGVILFGVSFISNNLDGSKDNAAEPTSTENELMQPQNEEEPVEIPGDDDNKIEELEVGAYFEYLNPEDQMEWDSATGSEASYDYSNSNYNLYVAHLRAAVVTERAYFLGHQKTFDDYFNKYRDSILFYLNKIKPGEDKTDELQKAIQLAEQVIENNAEKGDPALDELHTILHELDEYYNTKPFVDYKTTQQGLRFP